VLTVASEGFPQIWQARICAVLVNQLRQADAVPWRSAYVTLDFEQLDFADKLSEGDGSAAAHMKTAKWRLS